MRNKQKLAIINGKMKNKIKQLLDSQGITPYRFQKETGLSVRTSYKLYNEEDHLPDGKTIAIICNLYKVEPNDILETVDYMDYRDYDYLER